MSAAAEDHGLVTNWRPEQDPRILRRIGKTGEECSELSKVCFRITIQGLHGVDPATGRSNLSALADEVADVLGQCEETMEVMGLDPEYIRARAARKRRAMKAWETMNVGEARWSFSATFEEFAANVASDPIVLWVPQEAQGDVRSPHCRRARVLCLDGRAAVVKFDRDPTSQFRANFRNLAHSLELWE